MGDVVGSLDMVQGVDGFSRGGCSQEVSLRKEIELFYENSCKWTSTLLKTSLLNSDDAGLM